MQKFSIFVLLIIATTFAIKNGPTAVFSNEDRSMLKTSLIVSQRKDGSWGSAAETHYAVSSLNVLGTEV
jgi:hypothetical protein